MRMRLRITSEGSRIGSLPNRVWVAVTFMSQPSTSYRCLPSRAARLVREWHSRTHTVAVLDDAFEFEGRRYRSLTQIAREITGAHWSGPRFFGLARRTVAAGDDAMPMPHLDPDGTIDVGQVRQGEQSIEARRETEVGKGRDRPCRGQRVKERADG
jgi:Protein of unknown function (DUF2924)